MQIFCATGKFSLISLLIFYRLRCPVNELAYRLTVFTLMKKFQEIYFRFFYSIYLKFFLLRFRKFFFLIFFVLEFSRIPKKRMFKKSYFCLLLFGCFKFFCDYPSVFCKKISIAQCVEFHKTIDKNTGTATPCKKRQFATKHNPQILGKATTRSFLKLMGNFIFSV